MSSNAAIEPSGIVEVYPAAIADTNLITGSPAYTTPQSGKSCRLIIFVGGALEITRPGALGNLILPAVFAGIPLPIRAIALVAAGTGAGTSAIIQW